MPVTVEFLRRNLARATERVEAAKRRAGRDDEVRVLAATKYLQVDQLGLLKQAGLGLVGENRADALLPKWEAWGREFEFHFIGHLQTRKVRDVLPCVSLIHSVESLRLVEELDRRAESPVKVLVEVNVAGEDSKYGILPRDAEAFLEQCVPYQAVTFTGFMTMAPLVSDPEEARPVFRGLRELRDRLVPLFAPRYTLTELSMGMSNDFEVAVEEGATLVRLGSTLFSEGG